MSNQQSWVEALNINPESLSEWSAQAPAGKPLLVWCLEQGHVSLENYFKWAQEFFGLPVLDSAYFPHVNSILLDEARAEGSWHPWRFPIEKWDDVTIVACVEPPTDTDHPTMSFVLADPRAMSAAWGPGVSQVNISSEPTEIPEGFTASTKPFVLNLEGDLFTGTSSGMHALPAAPIAEPPPANPPPAFEDDSLLIANEEFEKPAAPPKLKVVKDEPTPVAASIPANIEEAVQAAFKDILTKYHHVVLMKVVDNKARLFKADPGLKTVNAAKSVVDLSFPTFMRIVSKTSLPYHGYLIDSPAHREFFENLGLPELPGCVTALPIAHDGKVLGVLVALGSPEALKNDFLNHVSHAAARLSKAISEPWSKAS